MLDLAGRTVIPGMVDAHAHFLGLGETLRNVDLVGTRSYDEVIARVAARAKELPKGTWILGRGWDQNDWGDTAFPTHEALSRAVPDHPVYLTGSTGTPALVNEAAMRAAEARRRHARPGAAAASSAQRRRLADRRPRRQRAGARRAGDPAYRRGERATPCGPRWRRCNRWGLTGIHDAGVGPETIDLYEELAKARRATTCATT